MKRALIVLSCLSIGSVAAAEQKPMRKVAVAQFEAPKDSHARNAVLATLSDHDDIEVISLEDIAFEANRLKADPKTPAGRKKIAGELGVAYWLDAEVDDSEAKLKLSNSEGRQIAHAEARAAAPSLLEALVGERMWAAMGPTLSAKEGRRRTLLAQADLARTKIADREREIAHQADVARQRAEQRVNQIKAERELAVKKRAALLGEVARQEQLVTDRRLAVEREHQQALDAQRRAEAAQKAQMLAAQQAEQQRQQAALEQQRQQAALEQQRQQAALVAQQAQQPAAVVPQQPQPVYAQQQQQPPMGNLGYSAPTQTYPGYSSYPAAATSSGRISPSTQRWLQSQQAASASLAPQQAAQPADAATNPHGVSPATQRWLAQQQLR